MINKEHPDFHEYQKKYWDIVDAEDREIRKIKNPNVEGNDGEQNSVHKKYVRKIVDLQRKYSHIFSKQ